MGYIIGVDQGGTKTHVAIMDHNGQLLSDHKNDGCYFPHDGVQAAIEVINIAIAEALKKAKIKIEDISMLVAGITGIDYEGDEALMTAALGEVYPDKDILVCNDCEIAYYSGTLNEVGAVICAGTGINAAMFAPDGSKFVMGDYLKSSLQGGVAIAIRAIEAVMEADLGVLPATALTKIFLDFSGDATTFDLLRRYITDESFTTEIIGLAPQIIKSADQGDEVARGILDDFAQGLCACFIAALRKMKMQDLGCDVVLAGSIFKGPANYLVSSITKQLTTAAKQLKIINAAFEPIVGACILGMIKTYGEFTELNKANAKHSAVKWNLLRSSPENQEGGN